MTTKAVNWFDKVGFRMKSFVAFFTIIYLVSCTDLTVEPDQFKSEQERNFEIFWNNINNTYPLFDYDKVNWDSIYKVYHPKILDKVTDEELFDIFANMLRPLGDGHISLISPNGKYWRNERYAHYKSYFSLNTVVKSYLNNKITPIYEQSSNGAKVLFRMGRLQPEVLYIHIASFNVQSSFKSAINPLLADESLKGIVVDLRGNAGGDVDYLQTFLDCFSNTSILYGYYRVKLGPLKDNLSYPKPLSFGNNTFLFSKPIILLTDRKTYSAAERAILALRTLPNVTVVGDTTGGALGLVVERTLPNGIKYSMVDGIMQDVNFNIIERVGIPPDLPIKVTEEMIKNDKDPVVEKALELLK